MAVAREIHRQEVQAAAGAQLVEVLPAPEYRWRHIAGARSLPLTDLTRERADTLDDDRPVVVYCNDFQ
jgi:rhodanese-related sulfurtransferase